MKRGEVANEAGAFERALKRQGMQQYELCLYVAGMTRRSVQAIESVKRICEEHLQGRYALKVVDVYQQPVLAKGEQIIAAPNADQAPAAAVAENDWGYGKHGQDFARARLEAG